MGYVPGGELVVAIVDAEKVKVSLRTAPVIVPVKAGFDSPKTREALFADSASRAGVTVTAKLTAWLTPAVMAVATKSPTCVPVTITLACPLPLVVTVALGEKVRPAPAKVTVAPATGFPMAFATITTRACAKAVPRTADWALPPTNSIVVGRPVTMLTVTGLLELVPLFGSPE